MEENHKFNFQDTLATQKIFSLTKRIRAVCGGTSASKTISILVWLIDYCQTRNEKKVDVMSESYPHLEEGAIKDFKAIMMDRGYWKDECWNETKHKYTFETRTVLKFISIDKLGKAHGPRRDVLFINEANNIDYNIYDQLEVRTKEVIWLDWNPSTEFWYYTEIKDKVIHDFITLTYLDCLNVLDPRIVESIESKRHKTTWWTVYGEGKLGEVEGRIYKGWGLLDQIPLEAILRRYGVDFGFSNDPTVIIAIYYWNGTYILDEVTYQKGLSNKTIADILDSRERALVVADSADPKSIDEIASYGINIVGAKKGPGSVLQGIQWVQGLKIFLTTRSVRTLKAYRNFLWLVDKNGRVINEPDDTIHEWSNPMDAIRYGLDSFRPLIPHSPITDTGGVMPYIPGIG
jgi:phage terminase large subunit